MSDAELNFKELNLNTDLNEFNERDEKLLNFNKDSKMFSTDHYYLLLNLNIFVDIYYFCANIYFLYSFYSLFIC